MNINDLELKINKIIRNCKLEIDLKNGCTTVSVGKNRFYSCFSEDKLELLYTDPASVMKEFWEAMRNNIRNCLEMNRQENKGLEDENEEWGVEINTI